MARWRMMVCPRHGRFWNKHGCQHCLNEEERRQGEVKAVHQGIVSPNEASSIFGGDRRQQITDDVNNEDPPPR